ncbi:unnamed protein product, partial [Symbiodinium sp. CCMP2456]
VDRLALWLRCSVPARVQAAAKLHADDLPDDKDRGEALGVQRGRETAFRAKFIDGFGRTILNASEYWLRWSLVPTGSKDGVPFQKAGKGMPWLPQTTDSFAVLRRHGYPPARSPVRSALSMECTSCLMGGMLALAFGCKTG